MTGVSHVNRATECCMTGVLHDGSTACQQSNSAFIEHDSTVITHPHIQSIATHLNCPISPKELFYTMSVCMYACLYVCMLVKVLLIMLSIVHRAQCGGRWFE